MTSAIHPWERSGLGKAPFKFIGMFESVYQACQGAPIQPGSSCDYCGQGIRYVYRVRSADGREFKVGCDCILSLHTKLDPIYGAAKKAQLKHQRAARKASGAARADAALNALQSDPTLLTKVAHPQPWRAAKGETMRDSVLWFFTNAGAAGKLKASRIVEKAMSEDGF